jgi:hypothetical protein
VLGQLARHYDVLHVDLAANPAIYDKRMWGGWTGCTRVNAGTG